MPNMYVYTSHKRTQNGEDLAFSVRLTETNKKKVTTSCIYKHSSYIKVWFHVRRMFSMHTVLVSQSYNEKYCEWKCELNFPFERAFSVSLQTFNEFDVHFITINNSYVNQHSYKEKLI